jgi:hypothetical protein
VSELKSGSCHYCSQNLSGLDYGRADTCSNCGKDTRVCKNCLHFDSNKNNQCRETLADRVVEKEKSNFCDYFSPVLAGSGSKNPTREDLKLAAESLFKKK